MTTTTTPQRVQGAKRPGSRRRLPVRRRAHSLAGTLGITYWASKRTGTTAEFYSAGRSITGFQNGWAVAGDTPAFSQARSMQNLCPIGFGAVMPFPFPSLEAPTPRMTA